jgi:hypothetical protein
LSLFFIFRAANEVVKSQGTKPLIALANLHISIEEKYEDDNEEALLNLPSRRSTLQSFLHKRKLTRPQNFNPLAPPENLYVSFNFIIFYLCLF